MEWQPIETAPIIGEFLVFGGEWEGEINSDTTKQKANLVIADDKGVYYVKGTDFYSAWIKNPTHWMPLLPPPQGA